MKTIVLAVIVATAMLVYPTEESFDIAVGETVDVLDLLLSFQEVTRDSRCPRDVQCIVAGEAILVFTGRNAGELHELTFELAPGGTDSQTAGPYTVTVEALEPEPESTKKIATSEYVASVTVTKH